MDKEKERKLKLRLMDLKRSLIDLANKALRLEAEIVDIFNDYWGSRGPDCIFKRLATANSNQIIGFNTP